MRVGLVFWIVLGCLIAGCGDKPEKVTREQCSQIADRITQIIIDHYTSHPDELWEGMPEPYETGIPNTVNKDSFKAFLASPEGKTWMMQRQGQVRSSAEQGIEVCEKVATPALVKCLLAAKTRDDVTDCDKKYPPPGAARGAPGSAAPAATPGSAAPAGAPGSAAPMAGSDQPK